MISVALLVNGVQDVACLTLPELFELMGGSHVCKRPCRVYCGSQMLRRASHVESNGCINARVACLVMSAKLTVCWTVLYWLLPGLNVGYSDVL